MVKNGMSKYFYGLVMVSLFFSCKPARFTLYPIQDNTFHLLGRAIYDGANGIRLISSASGIAFDFEGDSCIVNFRNLTSENNHGYAVIELDGAYYGRYRIDNAFSQPLSIQAKDRVTIHHVQAIKATEAQNGDISILNVSARKVKAASTRRSGRIEFIGNSITCGMGNDISVIPCGQGQWYDQHNAYNSYATITARALNLEPMLSAVSGIGIYRCWNVDCPAMPDVYESLHLGADSTHQWDFNQWTPDIVSIALGTNDFSDGDGVHERKPFDAAIFVQRYLSFIQTIYRHYPKVQIILLTSPMLNGDKSTELYKLINSIADHINALKINRPSIKTFQFAPMHATGCSGHPNKAEHQVMADQLIPFIKTFIK